jgi:hypothetical protein
MTHGVQGKRHAHTIFTVLWSEACLPNHIKTPDPQAQNFKSITFLRCTYTYTCDVCNKALRISMQPKGLLHTPQVHGHYLQNTHWGILTHTALLFRYLLKIFTEKHNHLCTDLFTYIEKCLFNGSYTCTIYFQLTDSFHGKHVHKEQKRCTTFGWNTMGETSSCL